MTDQSTYVLPDAPECPGCGLEADVTTYYTVKGEMPKRRVGYTCVCGTRVVFGIVQTMGDF